MASAFAEVPLLQNRSAHRTVVVSRTASDAPGSWFQAGRFGGGRELTCAQPGETRLLRWSCSDPAGCVLDLAEVSLNAELKGASVSFAFSAPISPDVCVVNDAPEDAQELLVFALTADGVLHRIRLPQPAPDSRSGPTSVLADVTFDDVTSVDVNSELRRLDRCASRPRNTAGKCKTGRPLARFRRNIRQCAHWRRMSLL